MVKLIYFAELQCFVNNTNACEIFVVNLHTNQWTMRCWNICLFINFFVCLSANGKQLPIIIPAKNIADSSTTFFQPTVRQTLFSSPTVTSDYLYKTPPASFYTNSLSFFCKKELQVEKAVKFPVKMRLGNVTYTDKLEGKITARSTE